MLKFWKFTAWNYAPNVSVKFIKHTRNYRRNYCSILSSAVNLNVNNDSLNKYIRELENEYKTLKEYSNLQIEQEQRLLKLKPVITILESRNVILENITHLKDLFEDKDLEIRNLAISEKNSFEEKLKLLDEELLEAIIPVDDKDSSNGIVLEVNAGVGGQEAMLFAKELFDMYFRFAEYKNWAVEVAEYLTTEQGGIRHASLLIDGSQVIQYYKHEAGVHRVQRIPATEKSGRIHTSTASVLVLPQPKDIEIVFNNKDLKIDTKRASGAGGQHVNTTDSAVRITHLPTGLSVECQVDRSQIKNKKLALQKLRAVLYDHKLKAQINEIQSTKKSQVKSHLRSEKIRTYNYSQDRISDHRLQGVHMHNLKRFFEDCPKLENLMLKLHKNKQLEDLLSILNKYV